ncbi:ras-related protein Rab-13-like [Gigantopelta aegis]|uniref:ras-related protein Rab-13-like n=1 Tax=Gigantopelta aegis TaxID=1735272 RepID=UPI001B887A8C|nr:ras-related protein Rab-13-like [Gigantopelta aegis]XP_041352346.1 ras-related protein Rab-13-like [Gigantopelta aegis]
MSTKMYDSLIRLLLVGDTGVGKTCLICRYAHDQFSNDHVSTIGVDFKVRTIEIDGQTVKVQIWDTAGQERFEAITKQFYRRAQGVMVVYDITNQTSFLSLPKWMAYIKQFAKEDAVLMLVGNKNDKETKRQIEYKQGQQFARENGLQFFETSAKSKEHLERAFNAICKEILFVQNQRPPSEATSSENTSVQIEVNGDVNNSDTTQLVGDEGKAVGRWQCCYIL